MFNFFSSAFTLWVSLCKHLPGSVEKLSPHTNQCGEDLMDPLDGLKVDEDYYYDYNVLVKVFELMFSEKIFFKRVGDVEPCHLSQQSSLFSLAVGSKVNKQATDLYDKMMEVASLKGLIYQ